MSETWVEATLRLAKFDREGHKRLVLDFVKPVIKSLEEKRVLQTFHFLFESGPRLLLRMQPKTRDNVDEIKQTVNKHLTNIRDYMVKESVQDPFTSYTGEAADFGEDGWTITKKIFEMGSRMGIAKLDPESKNGRKFVEVKLLHCFLNSIGHSILAVKRQGKFVTSEAFFYLDSFIGRMLIIRDKRVMDPEVAEEIGSLTEEKIQWWTQNPTQEI